MFFAVSWSAVSRVLIGLFILIAAFGYLALRLGKALWGRVHNAQQVTDSTGQVWITKVHWATPGADLGFRHVLLRRTKRDKPNEDDLPTSGLGQENKKKKSKWWDAIDLPFDALVDDELGLILLGLVALIGILVAAFVVLILAIEIAILLVVAAIMATVRLLFGHPWTIEVRPEGSDATFYEVKGMRKAIRAHSKIRAGIEQGTFDAQKVDQFLGDYSL